MNMRKGLGKGKGKGYYNIVPMDSHIHSLSAKGVKTYSSVVKDIQKLSRKDRQKLFLGMAYGVGGNDTRSLDFRTESVDIPTAKEMVKVIKYYNEFDYKKVNEAIDKVKDDINSIQIGREGSPVIYIGLPYWENQKMKPKGENRKLTEGERQQIINKVEKAFFEAEYDEFNVDEFNRIRIWWD